MKPILSFEHGSETIRQLPQNYLVAYKRNGAWVCDPDPAADKNLCTRVFLELFNHTSKHGNGLYLLSRVTGDNATFYVSLYNIIDGKYVAERSYKETSLKAASMRASKLRSYYHSKYPLISIKYADGSTYADFEL